MLREWREDDLPAMSELFDDPDIAHFTPLVTPFDLDAAHAYLAKAEQNRLADLRLQLAITADGGVPLGEVLLIRTDLFPLVANIGYSVGAKHRGRRLAARAVRVLTAFARDEMALDRVQLQIEPDNGPSMAVARAAGFRLAGDPPIVLEEKGRAFSLHTWSRDLRD